ncbi:DedA family protein [Schaalia vaccimaxillae]|uniref:DedA family protein n=1 Tax=Schaalia vaccimaxillae TaxID=183916 RepID=UPI0003B4CD27|nr:DedA family protein [Schaalia vaccimaxillae]
MIWPTLLIAASDSSWLSTVIGWFHDPESLLVAMGPWVWIGTLLIVLIESGVLFPVLPGDSLLFTAGLLHDRLNLPLPAFVATVFVAAFVGAQIGYWIGAKWGRRLFKPDARFLKTEHLEKAESYFDAYGGRSLVIGRFIPFVRTFIPLAAGIARYPYGKFLAFNSLGSLLWGVGITWLGSVLGGVEFVHDNLSMIIIAIVLVSLLPMVVEVVLQRRKARKEVVAAAESVDVDPAGSAATSVSETVVAEGE